jgi:hypothetical protein
MKNNNDKSPTTNQNNQKKIKNENNLHPITLDIRLVS